MRNITRHCIQTMKETGRIVPGADFSEPLIGPGRVNLGNAIGTVSSVDI